MDNLNIVDIYQDANPKKEKQFKENIESTAHVNTDYENVIRDVEWIEIIENTIPYLDNILRSPNRFIINEEEIVKIEKARKITVESIKNLSKNTNFIQEVDKKTGDVKPSKILNINKEESYDTYENRLIYTLIQNMKFFVNQRKKTLEQYAEASSKNSKHIEYTGKSKMSDEVVNVNLSLDAHLDSGGAKGQKAKNPDDILERISKLEIKISDLTSSEVYKIIDKRHISLVREPIKKTNVILKNVNFQYAMGLWTYLRENMDDKTKSVKEKNDYDDDGNLKELMDDSFYLDYLILSTLDKDKESMAQNETRKHEVENIVISKMLEKVIGMNCDMSEKDLKNIIGEKFAIIKYRNQASMQEIQNIFSKHITKYLEKIKM